jgi:hypothetical protein
MKPRLFVYFWGNAKSKSQAGLRRCQTKAQVAVFQGLKVLFLKNSTSPKQFKN